MAENYIEVIDYSSVITEQWIQKQYVDDFVGYYKYMNSEDMDNSFDSIKKHKAKKNMGEIHSLIFAHYLQIPLFMSNDAGAKNLAKTRINTSGFTVIVKNVLEIFTEIKNKGKKQLPPKKVRAILKQRKNWLEIYRSE